MQLANPYGKEFPEIGPDFIGFNDAENCGHAKKSAVCISWPSTKACCIGNNQDIGSTLTSRTCDGDCSYESVWSERTLSAEQADENGIFSGALKLPSNPMTCPDRFPAPRAASPRLSLGAGPGGGTAGPSPWAGHKGALCSPGCRSGADRGHGGRVDPFQRCLDLTLSYSNTVQDERWRVWISPPANTDVLRCESLGRMQLLHSSCYFSKRSRAAAIAS